MLPRAVRESYRQRLISFHLDFLPSFKLRVQSRIYRFLVNRHLRRKDKTRIPDIAHRTSCRLLLGPPKARDSDAQQHWVTGPLAAAHSMDAAGDSSTRERGARRRKFLALAGSAINAGRAAVTEIRETVNQGRSRNLDLSEGHHTNIPGAFPDVSIIVQGDEQMVLFPSYAKNHVRDVTQNQVAAMAQGGASSMNDRENWPEEWRHEQDKNAVIDVDIRGWIYTPHRGPMTRRNRLLIGAARQLSGIPAPRSPAVGPMTVSTTMETLDELEDSNEQARIAKAAKEIERKGQGEKEAATRGDYSENPTASRYSSNDPEFESPPTSGRSGTQTPISPPGSPTLGAIRAQTASELNDAELAVANANLMSRLGPFLTTPLARVPVTLFFYNDVRSASRVAETNDAGHFFVRAALEFVPTRVRVIANDKLSTVRRVHMTEPQGVSLISDIDDTIKKSNINSGAREIFRNAFARDLSELTIPGVGSWYNELYNMGVHLHYCSNSPWQLFPVLATFFKLAGLPEGSIHLKHYPGLLQGIFEPVAERKKPTLEKIMNDFPQRKFLLVGDSGEADLEVYTEIALAYPNRILAIFIRDVTSPEQPGFFDSSINSTLIGKEGSSVAGRNNIIDGSTEIPQPLLPLRQTGYEKQIITPGSSSGDLIDLSEEPEITRKAEMCEAGSRRKEPPPKPPKPVALRSPSSGLGIGTPANSGTESRGPPPPPKSRKPATQQHSSSQIQNIDNFAAAKTLFPTSKLPSQQGPLIKTTKSHSPPPLPPPPPPRRRGAPSSGVSVGSRSMAPRRSGATGSNGNAKDLRDLELPEPIATAAPPKTNSSFSGGGGKITPGSDQQPYNKKLAMWGTRLERAHDSLAKVGVWLYTWRRGEDVMKEAKEIVREALREMELWQ